MLGSPAETRQGIVVEAEAPAEAPAEVPAEARAEAPAVCTRVINPHWGQ